MTTYLITGVAGFIGFHLARVLLSQGHQVYGVDCINDYYEISLKHARLDLLKQQSHFEFGAVDLADRQALEQFVEGKTFDYVLHLAAQAGVRYSLSNPCQYVESNLVGFVNLLEVIRTHPVKHFVYASSSSIYGYNQEIPYAEKHSADHPISLYAATKKANELIAHSYSHLYNIPSTGLRFFTVYGPWGRPDMALFKFTKAILQDEPIQIYNYGNQKRDFTYIDDIVEGVLHVTEKIPQATPREEWPAIMPHDRSCAPYRVYNIGNNRAVSLMHFLDVLQQALGKKARIEMLPAQPGDLEETCADIDELARDTGFNPKTPIEEGIPLFVDWYRNTYLPLSGE